MKPTIFFAMLCSLRVHAPEDAIFKLPGVVDSG